MMSNYNNIVNEGGEGYVPSYITRSAPAAAAAATKYAHHSNQARSVAWVEAAVASDKARLAKMTDASAIRITQAAIDANIAWLAAHK